MSDSVLREREKPATGRRPSGRRLVLDLQQAGSFRSSRRAARLSRASVAVSTGIAGARLVWLEAGPAEPTLEEALALSRLYMTTLNRLHPIRVKGASKSAPASSARESYSVAPADDRRARP